MSVTAQVQIQLFLYNLFQGHFLHKTLLILPATLLLYLQASLPFFVPVPKS